MLEKISLNKLKLNDPIMVTGADGCIGSWVIAILYKNNIPCIAYDISANKKRLSLLLKDDEIKNITWIKGDITNGTLLENTIKKFSVKSIIHLAALQVPFCAEDPQKGALVNVVGTVNIFQAVYKYKIKRLTLASSVAAYGFINNEDNKTIKTLYGAYKLCNENLANVYWNNNKISSVCLRPGIVTGLGRDQGMTSKTTLAILAAVLNKSYTIPFSGIISNLHAAEAASAFIHSISFECNGSYCFDLNGPSIDVINLKNLINKFIPSSSIKINGEPLKFPGKLSDSPLRNFIKSNSLNYISISPEEATLDTITSFKKLLVENKISSVDLN